MTAQPRYRSNILVFRIGSLGDTLVSLPSFHLLRAQFPNHSITLLTNSPEDGGVKAAPSHQVLMGSGLIDKFIEYPHGRLRLKSIVKLVGAIRALKPEQVIYLMPLRTLAQRVRDLCLLQAAGIGRVRGLILNRQGFVHQQLPGSERYESEASRLVRSIGFVDIALTQPLFSLVLQKAEREIAHLALGKLSGSDKFIAMSIGAKMPVKDWGVDRWAELLATIRGGLARFPLVFIGSQDESERCAALCAAWPGETLNLCGKLTPRQSAAVLEQAAIFVGHDSGPMHLASSVGIPCVSVFSARSRAGVWFPYGNEENVFYNNIPCSNCGLNVCIKEEMVCIRSIRPLDVAAKIASILSWPTKNEEQNP